MSNTNDILSSNNLTKYLLVILTSLTVWIFKTTNDTDKGLSNLYTVVKIEKEHREKNLKKFDKFIESPRFTKSHFDNFISPYIIQQKINTDELKFRSDFIKNTTNEMIKLNYRLKQLER